MFSLFCNAHDFQCSICDSFVYWLMVTRPDLLDCSHIVNSEWRESSWRCKDRGHTDSYSVDDNMNTVWFCSSRQRQCLLFWLGTILSGWCLENIEWCLVRREKGPSPGAACCNLQLNWNDFGLFSMAALLLVQLEIPVTGSKTLPDQAALYNS